MIETSEAIATRIIEAREVIWGGLLTFTANPIFPAVTALLGAVTGAFVSQWFVSRREKARENREAEAVRTLLKLEIDHNRNRLEQRGNDLRKLIYRPGPSEDTLKDIGVKVIRLPGNRQTFQREALNAAMPKLPGALSQLEIQAVLDLYDDLGELFGSLSEPLPTDKTQGKVATMYVEAIDRVLKKGNPLA